MAKRLKKAPRAPKKKGDIPTPIKVRFGTRNELGPTHRFPTEAKAKAEMVSQLKVWQVWCERHNLAGLDAISEAYTAIDTLTFHRTPERLECLFDTRYDVALVIEYHREDAV